MFVRSAKPSGARTKIEYTNIETAWKGERHVYGQGESPRAAPCRTTTPTGARLLDLRPSEDPWAVLQMKFDGSPWSPLNAGTPYQEATSSRL